MPATAMKNEEQVRLKCSIEGHNPLSWGLVNLEANIVESQISAGVSYKLIRINGQSFIDYIKSWPEPVERKRLLNALRRRQERDFFSS